MSRRAVWRAQPDDPKTPLGWFARDAAWPLRIVFKALEGVLCVAAILIACDGHILAAFFVVGIAFLPAVLLDSVADWGRRALPVGPLLTLPPPTTPFPCRVEILRKGAMLGRDEGIVTFLDGWLLFDGARTAFSLRRADASARMGETIELAEGGEILFLPENLLVAVNLVEHDLVHRFKASLDSWWRSESPIGVPVLPPAAVHLAGQVRAWSGVATSLALLVAAFPWVFRLAARHGPWDLLLLLPLVWSFVTAVSSLRQFRCALKALEARKEAA